MPLEQFVPINSQQAYAIWHMQESETVILQQLDKQFADTMVYTAFKHPIKRIEWLAARLAYQSLCQAMNIPCLPIQKSLHGRPYIGNGQLHISLSRCFPFVGAT